MKLSTELENEINFLHINISKKKLVVNTTKKNSNDIFTSN